MRGLKEIKIAFALCLATACLVLLSPAPSAAQSDNEQTLVPDLLAFYARCPSQPLSESCANEKKELASRVEKLKLNVYTDLFVQAFVKFSDDCKSATAISQACANEWTGLASVAEELGTGTRNLKGPPIP